MQTKILEKYFFFSLLFGTLIFSLFIFSPFWVVLVLGISFSVVLYPVYEWLCRLMPNWVASLLTVFFFIIVIGLPLFGIGALVFEESKGAYQMITSNLNASSFFNSINTSINNFLPQGVEFDMYEKISSLTTTISNNIARVFTSTVSAIFSLFLTLLSMFYFLKDGDRWRKALIVLSPLSDIDDEKIIHKLKNAINGIMLGYLFVALLQGILMGAGLAVFGVPNPALWGLVAMFAAFVPTLGTAIVSIPIIIYLIATGDTLSAILFAVWSGIVVGMVDNFLSPVIVGRKINIPPLLMLFSVLGGIALLGPIGILIGPLSVSLLYVLLSLYRNEFREQKLM